MATFVPGSTQWGELGQSLGQAAGEGYVKHHDDSALRKSIEDLGPNPSPRDLLNAITKTKTYSNKSKQDLLKHHLGVAEFEETKRHAMKMENAAKLKAESTIAKKLAEQATKDKEAELKKNDALALVNNSNLPEEQKQVLANQINEGKLSYNAAKEISKPKKENKEPVTEFDKLLGKENAKRYLKATDDLVSSQRSLSDLQELEKINEKLRGPLGYFEALNPFSEEASALEALGFKVIEPMIKVFNPVGAIPQRKIETLSAIYGPKRFDSYGKIKGKIRVLKKAAKDANNYAQNRIDLYAKYNGNPPLNEVAQLDKQGELIVDKLIAEDPSKLKVFYSVKDGRPVQFDSVEKQEELLEKGLITDVKPIK